MDTVFAQTLSRSVVIDGRIEPRRIETQILHFDGLAWQPYCYVWNVDQTDAKLVDGQGGFTELQVPVDGKVETARTLKWRHHSRSECRACHANQTGGALVFSLENLRTPKGLQQFVNRGIVDRLPPKHWQVKQMVDPRDSSQPIEARARSYLHANCAHCHCRGGGGSVALDLMYMNANDQINAINFPVTQGNFEIPDTKVIVPGDPYSSVLFYRMASVGKGHMPKLWGRDNDKEGLKLIHDWIVSMSPETYADLQIQQQSPTQNALREFYQLLNVPDPNRVSQSLSESTLVTQGLFERFLPPEDRVQRLGTNIDRKSILEMRGDPIAGRTRFLSSKLQQCNNCHRLEGQGKMVGPDLDGIAKKRSKAELLESILSPSAKIEPKYVTWTVLTEDGNLVSGFAIEESTTELVLRSNDGKDHRVSKGEIVERKQQSKSLMPEGVAADMTAQELADLLEFLMQLN